MSKRLLILLIRRNSVTVIIIQKMVINQVLYILITFSLTVGQNEEGHVYDQKIRHKPRGKYTVKEEVVKKVAENNHPCRLTKTAVKVTFPGMKSEVLVSFLGYKEPNLMHVNRCKGFCSDRAIGPVACVPLKRRLKKVRMRLKTQMLGSEDVREKMRELVFEDHEECACQCLTVSPSHCMEARLFNNETCSCSCEHSLYQREQFQCAGMSDRQWDPVTCSCRSSSDIISVSDQHHQRTEHRRRQHHQVNQSPHLTSLQGDGDCGYGSGVEAMTKSDYVANNGYTVIGVCSFFIGLFLSTTVYYWRKSRRMEKSLLDDSPSDAGDAPAPATDNNHVHSHPSVASMDFDAFQRQQLLSEAPSITELEPSQLVCNSEGVMVPQKIDLEEGMAFGGTMGLPIMHNALETEAELIQKCLQNMEGALRSDTVQC